MSEKTEIEQAAIVAFLTPVFGKEFTAGKISKAETDLVKKIVQSVTSRFTEGKYILGLALDFTVIAQKVSDVDPEAKAFRPELDETALFARYPQATSRKGRNVNTLTITFPKEGKTCRYGIRQVEEAVCNLFIGADRPGYPSAYVYNTGMWHHYRGLLVDCFRLSESGRFLVCQQLVDFGLAHLPMNTFYGRENIRPRLYEQILTKYSRTATAAENAGMVFQGIAYGYFKADRSHLSLVVDKSRTGSAKQRRFGDIDCYYGLDLEVSIEVKDGLITAEEVENELGQFAKDVNRHRVQGIAFIQSIEEQAEEWLSRHNILLQSQETILNQVRAWDWRKQEAAVHGLLHFLAHVEQNPNAVIRLLEFIRQNDPMHDSLAYFQNS